MEKNLMFYSIIIALVAFSCNTSTNENQKENSKNDCYHEENFIGSWYQEPIKKPKDFEEELMKTIQSSVKLNLNSDGTYTFESYVEASINIPNANIRNASLIQRGSGKGKWKIDCKYILYEKSDSKFDYEFDEQIKRDKEVYKMLQDNINKHHEKEDRINSIEHQEIFEVSKSIIKTDTKVYKRM